MSSFIDRGRMRETDIIKGKESTLPRTAGVYRHVNKETGTVDYAGQTSNLRKRQQEHAREGRLNTETQKIRYSPVREGASRDDLCRTERNHIGRHKPSGNRYGGGNGRR